MAARIPTASRGSFGRTPDGREVEAVTLANAHGLSVRILTLGATVQALCAPDCDGRSADVVLGYATAAEYSANREYLGVTLGRYANRIANGRFTLDGEVYQLATNDGPNLLHGGVCGFGRALWTVADLRTGENPGVTLTLVSPDGDDGFPGTLAVSVTFDLIEQRLEMRYRATTDRPTIVNLSNHSYFNLTGTDGGLDVLDHFLTIPADSFLPIDGSGIPTGELRAVDGTAFDFRRATKIGSRIREAGDSQLALGGGYDHNWVLDRAPRTAPRLVARVREPRSGRVVEVAATQPGLQFYSGNHLDGSATGKAGRAYAPAAGFSLEPQFFPDTPNQPSFGNVRLAPGDVYDHAIIYRFSVSPRGDCA